MVYHQLAYQGLDQPRKGKKTETKTSKPKLTDSGLVRM